MKNFKITGSIIAIIIGIILIVNSLYWIYLYSLPGILFYAMIPKFILLSDILLGILLLLSGSFLLFAKKGKFYLINLFTLGFLSIIFLFICFNDFYWSEKFRYSFHYIVIALCIVWQLKILRKQDSKNIKPYN